MNITHLAFFFFPGASEVGVGATVTLAAELVAVSTLTIGMDKIIGLEFEEPSAGTLICEIDIIKAEVQIEAERKPIRFRN